MPIQYDPPCRINDSLYKWQVKQLSLQRLHLLRARLRTAPTSGHAAGDIFDSFKVTGVNELKPPISALRLISACMEARILCPSLARWQQTIMEAADMSSIILLLLVTFVPSTSGYSRQRQGLTAIPDDIPRDDWSVDLQRNSIAAINAFPPLTNIRTLNLDSNLLSSFPNVTIVAGTLQELRLNQNQITAIEPDLLDALTNLAYLSLSYNQLTIFPDVQGPGGSLTRLFLNYNAFTISPKVHNVGFSLYELKLTHNQLLEVDFSGHMFPLSVDNVSTSVGLTVEDVSPSLEDTPGTSCRYLNKLNSLYLNYNLLSAFPDVTCAVESLAYLGLSNNKITFVNPDLLNPLTKLYNLDLRYNMLTAFPDVPGPGGSLSILYLSSNTFTVAPTLYRIGSTLTYLQFERNQLNLFRFSGHANEPRPGDGKVETASANLKTLNLNYNLLPVFPDVTIASETLQTLSLYSNKITFIDPDLLNVLTSLVSLDLRYNKIASLPDVPGPGETLQKLYLGNNAFKDAPVLLNAGHSLLKIDYGYSDINTFDLTDHISSPHLVNLRLHINIGIIPKLDHVVSRGIRKLDVSYTGLTYIHRDQLKVFKNLDRLIVSGNNFTTFPDISVVGGTLQYLYVRSNKSPLTMKGDTFTRLLALKYLDTYGSTWNKLPNFCHLPLRPTVFITRGLKCDCHSKWLKLAEASGFNIRYDHRAICVSPQATKNRNFTNVAVSDLICLEKKHDFYTVKVDINNYNCASAPITDQIPVSSPMECAMLCRRQSCCIYFNVDGAPSTGRYICSLTDICNADLTRPHSFSTNGTWYSLD